MGVPPILVVNPFISPSPTPVPDIISRTAAGPSSALPPNSLSSSVYFWKSIYFSLDDLSSFKAICEFVAIKVSRSSSAFAVIAGSNTSLLSIFMESDILESAASIPLKLNGLSASDFIICIA